MGIGGGGRCRWESSGGGGGGGSFFFKRRKEKVGATDLDKAKKKGGWGGAGANTHIPGLTKSRKLDNLGSGVGHMQWGGEVVRV